MSTRICRTAYSVCAASTVPKVSGDIARLPAASHTSCEVWPRTVAAPKIAAERLTDIGAAAPRLPRRAGLRGTRGTGGAGGGHGRTRAAARASALWHADRPSFAPMPAYTAQSSATCSPPRWRR